MRVRARIQGRFYRFLANRQLRRVRSLRNLLRRAQIREDGLRARSEKFFRMVKGARE